MLLPQFPDIHDIFFKTQLSLRQNLLKEKLYPVKCYQKNTFWWPCEAYFSTEKVFNRYSLVFNESKRNSYSWDKVNKRKIFGLETD